MDDLTKEYWQGAAADSESECPHPWYELNARCWWMAGFYDAQRGYLG